MYSWTLVIRPPAIRISPIIQLQSCSVYCLFLIHFQINLAQNKNKVDEFRFYFILCPLLYRWRLSKEGTSQNVPIAGFEMILREDYGPNSQQLTIFKSMVYSNPLTKISAKWVWSNAYNNWCPIMTARRNKISLFRAYFSQRIWINHGF